MSGWSLPKDLFNLCRLNVTVISHKETLLYDLHPTAQRCMGGMVSGGIVLGGIVHGGIAREGKDPRGNSPGGIVRGGTVLTAGVKFTGE